LNRFKHISDDGRINSKLHRQAFKLNHGFQTKIDQIQKIESRSGVKDPGH